MVTKELEKVASDIVAAIRNGSISWNELLNALMTATPSSDDVVVAPLTPITQDHRDAIATLESVYGTVAPESRRTLDTQELAALHEERSVLKTVETMAKDRGNQIRTYILNHADILAEQDGLDKTAAREKDGHYAAARRIPIDNTTSDWSVEPRDGAASLDVNILKALADSDEADGFSHDDYIAMTKQTRVFDETKAMKVLADRPELVEVIKRATVRGKPSVTVTVRARKS
jgi:hypothetical protein